MPGSSPIHDFCFVHAADLHLDTPFEGIRGVAPEVSDALRDASLEAWDALVELCIERRAAFLVVAGDVYDGAVRGLRAQLRFRSGLQRLSEADVAVFVVHGNHDPSEEGWSAVRERPPGCTVFAADAVRGVPVVREGHRIATVHGISYARRDTTENLAMRFPRASDSGVSSAHASEGLRVGLLHCNVGAVEEHAPYSPCTLADLSAAAIDYWALGHLHRYQVLQGRPGSDVTEPWVVYSGNLQGRSTGATERGAKGAVVVEVESGRVENVEFCALDRVRFLEIGLDVAGCADLAELERQLRAESDALCERHPGSSLVFSARLFGRSALHHDLARADRIDDLLMSLRDGFGVRGDSKLIWWARLDSEVRPEIDRVALREGGDYAAELVALADELAERPEELQAFVRSLCAELPADLHGVPLPQLEPGEAGALLAAAEDAAFDRLELFGVLDSEAPAAELPSDGGSSS